MARSIKDSELVIGLITTVGTEIETVIGYIKTVLDLFKYEVIEIVVSAEILSQFDKQPPEKQCSEFNRITHYMDLGNKIRILTGENSILMRGVARQIFLGRNKDSAGNKVPRNRTAYIIKSIKHPDEVSFLRDTYGEGFHLVGITSSFDRRVSYLSNKKGLKPEEAEELLIRDANEDFIQGQHTQDAFQLADYFISITEDSDKTYNDICRLFDLLFGHPFITPTFDEYAMFMAYASSIRSADLSRQIGSVITRDYEILATGANDCPKYGGGLYWPEEKEHGKYEDIPNGRDYTLGYDSNKIEQQKIIKSIMNEFKIEDNEANFRIMKKAGIGDLTEYGRVVHAEMESLMACARNSISCKGATLYATTFPCHNCAKHIIAAGIKRVVYIEPYPKSKALDYYKLEISQKINEPNKVVFEPFIGVGPQKYIDLFAVSSSRWYTRKRKDENGMKLTWSRETAELRNPTSLLTYIEAEKAALLSFEEETSALRKDSQNE